MSVVQRSILLILVCFGVGAAFYFKKASPVPREEISGFADVNQSIYTSRGVVDRIIQIEFSKKTSDDSQEIFADVSMPFNYSGALRYTWSLGEGVSLKSGNLTGVISKLDAGSIEKLKISVSGFDQSKNHHIGLEVIGNHGSRRIYGDGLFASKPEETFEHIVQNVERIKASRAGKSRD